MKRLISMMKVRNSERRVASGDLGRAKPRPGRRIPNGLGTLLPVTSKPTISIVRVLMFLVLSFGMLTGKMLTLLASPLAPLQRRGESPLVNSMRIFVKFFILVGAEFRFDFAQPKSHWPRLRSAQVGSARPKLHFAPRLSHLAHKKKEKDLRLPLLILTEYKKNQSSSTCCFDLNS